MYISIKKEYTENKTDPKTDSFKLLERVYVVTALK